MASRITNWIAAGFRVRPVGRPVPGLIGARPRWAVRSSSKSTRGAACSRRLAAAAGTKSGPDGQIFVLLPAENHRLRRQRQEAARSARSTATRASKEKPLRCSSTRMILTWMRREEFTWLTAAPMRCAFFSPEGELQLSVPVDALQVCVCSRGGEIAVASVANANLIGRLRYARPRFQRQFGDLTIWPRHLRSTVSQWWPLGCRHGKQHLYAFTFAPEPTFPQIRSLRLRRF